MAARAVRFDVPCERLVGLGLRPLLLPMVKEVVLALPEPTLREGLHVALDAAAHHHHVRRLEGAVRRAGQRVHQRRSTLTPDAARAVHEHLLTVQLLPRLGRVEPLWELVRVAHLGVDERRAVRRRLEVADRALVRIPHVDDHRVLVRHELVVLVRLHVARAARRERRRQLVSHAVGHELIRVPDRERLEHVPILEVIRDLEVGGVEQLRLPCPQAVAKASDALRRPRQGAIQALSRAPTTTRDAMLLANGNDTFERLLVLLLSPVWLLVLVEQDQGGSLCRVGRRRWERRERLEGHGAGRLGTNEAHSFGLRGLRVRTEYAPHNHARAPRASRGHTGLCCVARQGWYEWTSRSEKLV